MERIKHCPLLTHHKDSLEIVRKSVGLDRPGRVAESLCILEDWIKKQTHFNKKKFSRELLENLLVKSKGSVEKCKRQLDAVCTVRTIFPHIYSRKLKANEIPGLENMSDTILPKLTKEHYRVYIIRTVEKNYSDTFILNYAIRVMTILDYIIHFDYSAGLVFIVDCMDTDWAKMLASLANIHTRQALVIGFKAYAVRLKGVHILTKSKLAETFITTVKHIIGSNLIDRFFVHKTVESLQEAVDKDILPADYGGNEKSLLELCKNCLDIVSTDEARAIMKELEESTVDVRLKKVQEEYDEYLGVSGSFRSLSFD